MNQYGVIIGICIAFGLGVFTGIMTASTVGRNRALEAEYRRAEQENFAAQQQVEALKKEIAELKATKAVP